MWKVEEDERGRLRGRDAMRWGWRGCLLLPVALEFVTLVLLSWVFVTRWLGICLKWLWNLSQPGIRLGILSRFGALG